MTALIDTSVLILREQRPDDITLPPSWAVASITLGELYAGVIVASGVAQRAPRLRTLAAVEQIAVIPFDEAAARVFGELAGRARLSGRKARAADTIIAATAIAHGMTLYTTDRDFRAFPGLDLVLVGSPER